MASSTSSTTVADLAEAPRTGRKAVLLFWAPWHEASVPNGPMDQVLQALASAAAASNKDTEDDEGSIQFGRIQAEECADLTQKYGVTVVPTFVLLRSDGTVLERIESGGAEENTAAQVTQAVQRLMQAAAPAATTKTSTVSNEKATVSSSSLSPEEELSQRLDKLIRSSEVMLFMKGTPMEPRCGFSRQAVELLQEENMDFGSFDILSDETVRQGLKKHSNWPTYPQVYVRGELQGGLDILKELKEEGSLKEQWEITMSTPAVSTGSAPAPVLALEDRLGQLINRHTVMLFMKGLPSAPQCGFSRQMVEILDELGVDYDTFNILEDEEVRQGLKTFSDWPTYPQLYVKGDLIGGLDIVKEMQADGSLKDLFEL